MGNSLLRELPSIDELLRSEALKSAIERHSREFVASAAREALEALRKEITSGKRKGISRGEVISRVLAVMEDNLRPNLKKVINASGTILHTNTGRAVLAEEAVKAVVAAAGNCNLEFDLSKGERGERDSIVEGLITRLTGAEAATVVNNNAAAVLITLNTLAEGREVIISRGELIEIGGSFRLPEIIKKSGCVLVEVGTTNRTHPHDYIDAITPDTAIIFKAHTSNYRVVGFTSEVEFRDLVRIGRERGLPVVEDLGSGSLVDLSSYGLPGEPVVKDLVREGADVITFSGDKLLGGPQAGIIIGKKESVERIRKNPLKRALRCDKMTLAALEATLRLYLNPDRLHEALPVLRFITRPVEEIGKVATEAAGLIRGLLGEGFRVEVVDSVSVAGAGSLPGAELPTRAVSITSQAIGPEKIFSAFLKADPPILGRVSKDRFLLDMRTILDPGDVVPGGADIVKDLMS